MTGYIDSDGKYKRGKPVTSLIHDVSPQFKSWNHDDQRRRFGRDIIQPRTNGQPNREFVVSYPEESKEYFNQDQIDKAERNLGGL